MKTRTTIKSVSCFGSLANAAGMALYEVMEVGEGVKNVLRVGDVVFRASLVHTYVVGAERQEVERYDWNMPTLQGIKVRKFIPGDSFAIKFIKFYDK